MFRNKRTAALSWIFLGLTLGGCSTVAVNYQTHKIAIAGTTQPAAYKKAIEFCTSYNQQPQLVQETHNWQMNMWVYQCR